MRQTLCFAVKEVDLEQTGRKKALITPYHQKGDQSSYELFFKIIGFYKSHKI